MKNVYVKKIGKNGKPYTVNVTPLINQRLMVYNFRIKNLEIQEDYLRASDELKMKRDYMNTEYLFLKDKIENPVEYLTELDNRIKKSFGI